MSKKLTIYYDFDCGFCYKGCIFLKSILSLHDTTLSPIQSETKIHETSLKENSWIVEELDTKRQFIRSSAFWRLIRASPFPFLYYISKIPGVISLGDSIYTFVANHRPRTCKV